RGDRNNNGYVGYTLHTPYGSRTYDYPVVLNMWGQPTAAYRSEPFDGKYLIVRPSIGTREYILFTYPSGPFEIYDFGLGTAYANNNIPDEVKYAALLSEVRRTFGPTKDQDPSGFEDKVIKIRRGAIQVAQQFGQPSSSNETASITTQA